LHFQPILLLSPEAYSQFVEDIENYENWLEKIRFTQQAIAGKIDTVKPWFEKHVFPDRTRIDLRGYLLVFKRGFIGMDMFEDPFYVRISHGQMQEYGFLPKMKVERRSWKNCRSTHPPGRKKDKRMGMALDKRQSPGGCKNGNRI